MKPALSIILSLSFVSVSSFGQTTIDKTFPLTGVKELVVDVDHPNVTLQTWDRNEVAVKGTVSINNGENDANFELQASNADGILTISSLLKDKENIPRHVVIHRADDQEFIFKAKSIDDPEVQKFLAEKGRDYSYISNTLLIKIELQVFVPKNLKTTVDIKYGLVEFKTFDAPLKVVAKYSKVDATIPANIGGITARTKHGEILTNLDIKFDKAPMERERHNNWTEISAHPGKGQDYFIESTFGTVYLRKP
jgi:hypothetical protein